MYLACSASFNEATAATCAVAETRNVVWREEGREDGHEEQREGQEMNNRMCCHNLDLETTTQTFMMCGRPIPLCDSASVKHSSPWSCDESKKALFGDLVSFLVCARMFILLNAFLFTYIYM